MAATPPRRAKFSQSAVVSWSSGGPFDGYCLIGVVVPSFSGTDSAYVTLNDTQPIVRLPLFAYIPIVAGTFQQESSMIFTSDLEPPNTKYVCWYYDTVGRQIAGPSSTFTVTTDPFTPPTLTLTAPTAGSTIPTPS